MSFVWSVSQWPDNHQAEVFISCGAPANTRDGFYLELMNFPSRISAYRFPRNGIILPDFFRSREFITIGAWTPFTWILDLFGEREYLCVLAESTDQGGSIG